MRQFIYFKKDGTASKPVGLSTLMTAAGVRVITGTGPFVLTQDGEPVSGEVTRGKVLDSLRRRLSLGDIGPAYRIRNGKGNIVFRCREIGGSVDVIDTSGNDKADMFWSAVVLRFKDFHPRFAGAYVCKPSSQHRFGNAVDIFFDSLAHQDDVATWAVAHADELHAEHVISRDRIWTRGVGWHSYSGDYHAHLHVDFDPNFSSSLPCGVRN